MNEILLLSLLSVVLVLVAIAGAWPSFHKGKRNTIVKIGAIGDPLAVGVFLGAGLIHLLPKAAAGLGSGFSGYPLAFVLAGSMMLVLGWLEAGIGHLSPRDAGGRGAAAPIVAAGALAFHSFLAGSALGAERTESAILVLFLALIVHKGAAAFALGRLLTSGALSRKAALALMAGFIAALPVGVAVGVAIDDFSHSDSLAVPIILALGAGTFLHFGTVHHHFDGEATGMDTRAPTIAGFALMAVLAIFI